jgi:hypothetical protein
MLALIVPVSPGGCRSALARDDDNTVLQKGRVIVRCGQARSYRDQVHVPVHQIRGDRQAETGKHAD